MTKEVKEKGRINVVGVLRPKRLEVAGELVLGLLIGVASATRVGDDGMGGELVGLRGTFEFHDSVDGKVYTGPMLYLPRTVQDMLIAGVEEHGGIDFGYTVTAVRGTKDGKPGPISMKFDVLSAIAAFDPLEGLRDLVASPEVSAEVKSEETDGKVSAPKKSDK